MVAVRPAAQTVPLLLLDASLPHVGDPVGVAPDAAVVERDGVERDDVGVVALDELTGRDPLVLSCLGGVRSMTAARTLRYLGVTEAPISMSGGFREWKDQGLQVV